MKLNDTAEMLPITWPEFTEIHPFAPADQALGYAEIIEDFIEQALPDHRLCGYARIAVLRSSDNVAKIIRRITSRK
jgi:glycine cleavage system protein P-like pyridoxal-binding family